MTHALSPQQRSVWDLGRNAMHRVRVSIAGNYGEERLQRALQCVVERHPILGAQFVQDTRLKYPLQQVDAGASRVSLRVQGGEAELALPALHGDAETLRLLVEALEAELLGERWGDANPISYAQFTAWQNDMPPEVRAPLQAATALPYEALRQGEADLATVECVLPASSAHALRELARGCEVRPAAVCAALFAALLARLTEREEVVFALENAGRDFEDVRSLVGPVARWYPLSMRVPAALDRSALRCIEAKLREIDEDDAPLAEPHLLSHALGFAFRSFIGAGSFQIEHAAIDHRGPRHVLAVHETARGMTATLRYDRNCLAEASASVWLEQFMYGLRELAAARLPLRPRFERRETAPLQTRDYEPLHRSFARHAAAHPQWLALVCGDEQLRYGELEHRANQLAHRLGVLEPGTPVGLWAERRASSIIGLLAILKAGGAYVPLDPEAPRERLRQQLVGLSKLISRVPLDLPLEVILSEGPDERVPACNRASSPEQLASMIFTSGSTGVPKAVMISERGIASYTHAILQRLALGEGMHFATVSTLSADLGNTSVFGALASGGCLHLIDYETATDGARLAAYCRRWPLDVLKIVPSHLSALLDAGADVLPRRALVCGGEALTLALRRRLHEVAPTLALYNHYGPTETTVGALALACADLDDERGCSSIPIGRALLNAQAFVLDVRGELTTTGESGELYVGGDGLARGYFQRPAATAERFVPHPFADGARLYRTGDRARYRPDGTIEFLGRRDHQLKVRGFRVELGEIEAQLAQFPACAAATVLAKPNATGGHSLIAFVVPREGELDASALRSFLVERLPEYMIPSEMIALPALPRNRNGKVDRAELTRRSEQLSARVYQPPRDEVERVLCGLWSALLKVPRVGIDDDFFALGGHSLLAIPLIHRIREDLGCALPLQALFQAPTVAGLARMLQRDSLLSLRARGTRRPLFCFDPTGLHADAYRGLAARLVDRPIHVLSSATVDGSALARQVARHAQGPYQLLGWSLGGVLALAAARELERAGHEVAFLGILDTDPRLDLYARGEPDPIVELAAYLTQPEATRLREQPALHDSLRTALLGTSGAARVVAAVRWAQTQHLLAADVAPELFQPRYDQLRAASLYVGSLPAQVLRAPISAFWSDETRACRGEALPRWQTYTHAAASEHLIAGDHEAVLHSELVFREVAARLG